jgi:hypothetical protein
MKNPAAVALGRMRAAKHKKQIGKKGVSEYMRGLALKRHRSVDKSAIPHAVIRALASARIHGRINLDR